MKNYIKILTIKIGKGSYYLLAFIILDNCILSKKVNNYTKLLIPEFSDSFILKKNKNSTGFGHLELIDSNTIVFADNSDIIQYDFKNQKLKSFKYKNSKKNMYLWGWKYIDSSKFLLNYSTTYHAHRHDSSLIIYDFNRNKVIQTFCFDSSNLISESNYKILPYKYSSIVFNRFFIPYFNKKDKSITVSTIDIRSNCNNNYRGNILQLFPKESNKPVIDFQIKFECKKSEYYFEEYYHLSGLVIDDTIVSSTYLNNEITLTCIKNNNKKVINANPYFLPNNNDISIDSITSLQSKICKNYIAYTNLIYDSFFNVYYRTVSLPESNSTSSRQSNIGKRGILKMDRKMNLIGFSYLPLGITNLTPTSKGLLGLDWNVSKTDSNFHFYFIKFKDGKSIKGILEQNNLDNNNITKPDEIKKYLSKLNVNLKSEKILLIPIDNSCPSCLSKIGKYLYQINNDSSFTKIIVSARKFKIDEYLNKNKLIVNSSFYFDNNNMIYDYFNSLSNINLIKNNNGDFTIKEYQPELIDNLILELKVR